MPDHGLRRPALTTSRAAAVLRACALGATLALGTATYAADDHLRISDGGPEAALQQIFGDIEANRLDAALARTETLLGAYPNFRLAHLIRGDLLLARARPLATFGNANGTAEQLQDLREEAIARLQAYRDRPSVENYVPRYLLQMAPDQEHAVVVDTRRARLYVYRNEGGKPRFVADYYVSQGKAGAGKQFEGDNKTPLGVYHVTSHIEAARLPDLYGSGAFPLNYPNAWDRRQGRTGYGIWLHGSPSDTYARPPRSSEGCVVLANQDFTSLSSYVQPGLTPVIISNDIEWLSLDDWQAERSALNEAIENWRRDWESLDVERYLSHYSTEFRSDRQDYAGWVQQKRRVANAREWIKVEVRNVSMFRNPSESTLVEVTFEQDYRSDGLSDRMRKRQYWTHENGRWMIVYEGRG
ncbi:hypothetical protein C8261_05475 [Pseudothauera lacus]|uniref:L,D-TPase catalytic domain-containing protein n=2 Tax=Pseudothauera lacus TaxID=2136175 RepID=A0A2T4II61_9RHOO|nr:hypothetical protein C8261_05475 [Pseudothauera lacus]